MWSKMSMRVALFALLFIIIHVDVTHQRSDQAQRRLDLKEIMKQHLKEWKENKAPKIGLPPGILNKLKALSTMNLGDLLAGLRGNKKSTTETTKTSTTTTTAPTTTTKLSSTSQSTSQPTTTTASTTTTTTELPPSTTRTTTTTEKPANPPEHIRKDFRLLTKAEWQAFYEAVQQISINKPDPSRPESWYDVFAGYHRNSEAPAAHFSAAFIAWHALYLQSFENLLLQVNPEVFLPFWDPRPDTEIPNFCDSCLFTADLLGNSQGAVRIGPFKNRTVYPNDCRTAGFGAQLARQCYPYPNDNGWLINYDDFNSIINVYDEYEDFVNPFNGYYEEKHGGLHVTVSGHLGLLQCATNEPLFFMLHGFIQAIFDITMDNHYTYTQQIDLPYPSRSDMDPQSQGNSPALPFDTPLKQCLTDAMKSNLQYVRVPPMCTTDSQCNPTGSDMNAYWCKISSGRCASKIRIGGVCMEGSVTYPNNACFRESFCSNTPTCTSGVCTCTRADGEVVNQPPVD